MSDRRFEERLAELEAEAAESEANAAKWAQEAIDFESELKVAKARIRELEGVTEAIARYIEDDRGLQELARTIRSRFGGKA